MRLWCVVLMVGCSSPAATSDATPADAAPPPRPGVQDSSGGFIGQTTDAENAYWAAVLAGDDAGRKATLAMLTVDNYDRFLVGASGFMAPKADLTALANGTNPPGFTLDANAKAPLMDGATLADPFYAGFADALLSELDTADRATLLMTGGARNPAATDFTKVVEDLQGNHVDTALTDMTALLAYCNGGAVTDPMAYAARQAAHTLVHRQCFSGPLARTRRRPSCSSWRISPRSTATPRPRRPTTRPRRPRPTTRRGRSSRSSSVASPVRRRRACRSPA